jgi:hypothetical protein
MVFFFFSKSLDLSQGGRKKSCKTSLYCFHFFFVFSQVYESVEWNPWLSFLVNYKSMLDFSIKKKDKKGVEHRTTG